MLRPKQVSEAKHCSVMFVTQLRPSSFCKSFNSPSERRAWFTTFSNPPSAVLVVAKDPIATSMVGSPLKTRPSSSASARCREAADVSPRCASQPAATVNVRAASM